MPCEQDQGAYAPAEHLPLHIRNSGEGGRSRHTKSQSQKAMLSHALRKANTAVGLDNAQDFDGAREAYSEACNLLHLVLQRTSAQEDQKKLEAICRTYTSRIDELNQLLPSPQGSSITDHASSTIIENGNGLYNELVQVPHVAPSLQRPPLRLAVNAPWQPNDWQQTNSPPRPMHLTKLQLQAPEPGFLQSSFSKSPIRSRFNEQPLLASHAPGSIQISYEAPFNRGPSLTTSDREGFEGPSHHDFSISSNHAEEALFDEHVKEERQNSWLDPVNESGGSVASSAHSRTSSMGYSRRYMLSTSNDTEVEFGTALDAAIEAAYDEVFEPIIAKEPEQGLADEQIVAKALRKVELARERVRQTEREAYAAANEAERQRWFNHQPKSLTQTVELPRSVHEPRDFFDETSSDEEERQLQELTHGYHADSSGSHQQQQHLHHQPPSEPRMLPRESNSSGSTSRTWHSSMGSNPPTTATSPSAAMELATVSSPLNIVGPAMPPPTHPLPELPRPHASSTSQIVHNRKLSSQNHKQLKIQTTSLTPPSSSHTDRPHSEVSDNDARRSTSRPYVASLPDGSTLEGRQPDHPLGHDMPDAEDSSTVHPISPSSNKAREQLSSLSLRSLKDRNVSLTNLDGNSVDTSPVTPVDAQWGTSRAPAVLAAPILLSGTTREKSEYSFNRGMYLLEGDHYLEAHGTSSQPSPGAPLPLEPCPIDFLLRPFWLMRCLYQTLVHPHGGYLSAKLFVPREAWRVKGVKLKNIEDKIASCDMLTAALLKLSRVDTCDADAVLDEMQSFEAVLEQTQTALTRKLGNEVGISSTATLFREASGLGSGETASNLPRSVSVSGKSAFSWRRLKPKNSAANLGVSTQARSVGTDGPRDSSGTSTLPMTIQPTSKPARRDIGLAHFSGPNSHYMSSLAHLFDAVQALDQIARQVEDPGLRHADKTQVGLELCTRHAAEFFGFYICRFVLSDLGALMDKFIKRGSEWVLT